MKTIPLFASLLLIAAFIPPTPTAAQEGAMTPAEVCAAATPAETPAQRTFDAAEDVLQDGVDYRAVLCTSAGPITVDLFEEETPITVNNFVFLARSGYYNNTNFHRVILDFMAQAGDPTNTGGGGPGYQFPDEIGEGLVFDRPGRLAMANAGPDTNGSQFFITTVPTDWLNGAHTIFGEVLAGQDNVRAIRLRDPERAFEPGTLLETVVIIDDPDGLAVVEETPVPATAEEVAAAFAALPDRLPIILDRFGLPFRLTLSDVFALVDDPEVSGFFATGEMLAGVPAAIRADLGAYFADHGHQYTAAAVLRNEACDLAAFPVYMLNYGLDAYASAGDAAAALDDPRLGEMQAALGFEAAETPLGFPVFVGAISACGVDDLVYARGFQQRGRFVAMMEIIVTPDNADIAPALLAAFTRPLYEDALFAVLRPEAVGE